jgi:hypothetical protein
VKKWIVIVTVCAIALGGAYLVQWTRAPKREVERSRAALLNAKSWHFHTVRVFLNIPPETVDMDVVCPGFEHRIARGAAADGTPIVREYIKFRGQVYSRVEDQWVLSKTPAQTMWNCDQHGSLLDGDANSLPYSAILGEGTIRRGELRQSGSETCRDYEVVIPVPTNILEREYRFFLCINETDHLPRETRRTPRGSDHEDVITYTDWNDRTEPLSASDFPS